MRTKQINPVSRQKLLGAARRLMATKGFGSTSVDEICQCSGLTKGSFFHYFENKEALGEAVLESYCCELFAEFEKAALEGVTDPLMRVFGRLDVCITMACQSHGTTIRLETPLQRVPSAQAGCLLGMLAQEMSDTSPAMRNACCGHFNDWVHRLQGDLDAAAKQYRPKGQVDTEGLARHFIAVLEGSLILAKTHQKMSYVEDGLRHYKTYLAQVFGIKK